LTRNCLDAFFVVVVESLDIVLFMEDVESLDMDRFMDPVEPRDLIELADSARGSSGVEVLPPPPVDLLEEGRLGL
jgi:hypothetical protein